MKLHVRLLALLLLFASHTSRAQEERPKNTLGLNIGWGTIASLDYERIWQSPKTQNLWIASLGIGGGLEGDITAVGGRIPIQDLKWFLVVPHKVTYNIGKKHHFMEIGLGGIIVGGPTTQPYISYPVIGYRFIGKNNSTFKFHLSIPFSGLETDDLAFIPFGIGLGQLF
jgi:hypothetical protein